MMRRFVLGSLLAMGMGMGLALPALAGDATKSIAVTDAWARATPTGAQTGAAYITITNHGKTDDQLIGASTPVAKMAQLHTTIDDHGVMKMRPVKGST